ncbi:hypothetical protein [Falsiroseomonas tokyonensis]|uniref:Uncharacterized protein n=1 Tax=Falsiroseomonas tokyonensis TaxID=430521 RepID=A0ABV7C358_9PROT|nr:hypothetical protein [Falsiroseomonas tokyonensis]MBU8541647.1 hypothetical protein [Falsiroseomonas tokyonensis]
MNDEELIARIAFHVDPLVFEHQGSQPPNGFMGSAEWWATAKHSRRQRATEAATAAVVAMRALGLACVPHEATPAMLQAGVACLPQGRTAVEKDQCARGIWAAMLTAAERAEPPAQPAHDMNRAFPSVIRRRA